MEGKKREEGKKNKKRARSDYAVIASPRNTFRSRRRNSRFRSSLTAGNAASILEHETEGSTKGSFLVHAAKEESMYIAIHKDTYWS